MLNIEHANTVQLFISFERKQVESGSLDKWQLLGWHYVSGLKIQFNGSEANGQLAFIVTSLQNTTLVIDN